MALNQILFDHNGQITQATLLYNFEDFPDVLLVIPCANARELTNIITFTRLDKDWETVSPVKYRLPSTIQNISKQLNKIFQG